MRSPRTTRSYIQKRPEDYDMSITIRVPYNVGKQVKAIAKSNKWTCSEVIRAGLDLFLDEEKNAQQMDFFEQAG